MARPAIRIAIATPEGTVLASTLDQQLATPVTLIGGFGKALIVGELHFATF
jgi:hypothetical protein